MPWAKLDEHFHSNGKLQRAKKDANAVAGVYSRSLSYCSAGLSDGFVDGFWVSTIAPPKLLALVTAVELWQTVAAGEERTVAGRRDSGRRVLPDVTVVMPAAGYFIPDYLHLNPSKEEVETKRKRAAPARADVHQNGELHHTNPTQGLLHDVSASSSRPLGPVERLTEVCSDAKGDLHAYLTKLALELHLTEGDFEEAREAALSPTADSATAVAISVLKKRAKVPA